MLDTAMCFFSTRRDTSNVALVESYDGSSFTEIADVNTARRIAGASGVQTAALFFGGITPAPATVGNTESWDGTSWTEVNDLNTSRFVEMVDQLSTDVQFIFITHNKISMEKSTHLLGVTMRDLGVSKVVSVDVEQAMELTQS